MCLLTIILPSDEEIARYNALLEALNGAWQEACACKASPADIRFVFNDACEVSDVQFVWSSESSDVQQTGRRLLCAAGREQGLSRRPSDFSNSYWIGVPAGAENVQRNRLLAASKNSLHGKLALAEEQMLSVLSDSSLIFGEKSPFIAEVYDYMADLYFEQKRYPEHDAIVEKGIALLMKCYEQIPQFYAGRLAYLINKFIRCLLYYDDLPGARAQAERLQDIKDSAEATAREKLATDLLPFARYYVSKNDMARAAQEYLSELARHGDLGLLSNGGRKSLREAANFFAVNATAAGVAKAEFLSHSLSLCEMLCRPYFAQDALPPEDICFELTHIFAIHNESGVFDQLKAALAAVKEKCFQGVCAEKCYGYVNDQGQWQIAPVFVSASDFRGDFARVSFAGDKAVGVQSRRIDRNGRIVGLDHVEGLTLPVGCEYARGFEEEFSEGLVAVRATIPNLPRAFVSLPNTAIGYMDESGNIVIPPAYSYWTSFKKGVAAVGVGGKLGLTGCIEELHGAKYGLIDRTGKYIVSPQYAALERLDDGHYAFRSDTANGALCGIIDSSGKVLCQVEGAARIGRAGDGMYRTEFWDANFEKECGYLDATGKTVVSPRPWQSSCFADGLSRICEEDSDDFLYGFIDKSGQVAIECKFADAEDFKDGLSKVKVASATGAGNKCGYIDVSGEFVVPAIYDDISKFDCGVAKITVGGLRGLVDRRGRELCAPQYDSIGDFYEGLAAASKSGKFGLLDLTGKLVVPLQFDGLERMQDGLAAAAIGVGDEIRWGFVDSTGAFHVQPQYLSVKPFYDGLAQVEVSTAGGSKWGFVDRNGKVVIPAVYHWCSKFTNKRARVSLLEDEQEYFGIIDVTGKLLLPVEYKTVRPFFNGLCCVGRAKQ